jgi:hypothetical protein
MIGILILELLETSDDWYINFGATRDMTNHSDWFIAFVEDKARCEAMVFGE